MITLPAGFPILTTIDSLNGGDGNAARNKETLSKMKPTAFLINTSRGPVFVEEDVAEALHQNRLAGVGVDVLCQEPPKDGSPLLTAPNCVITPHLAWASVEARTRCVQGVYENIKAFLAGEPKNVVNP